MIIYEVSLNVDQPIALAYREWLVPHIQEMLSLPGFIKAELFEMETLPEPAIDQMQWTVHYYITDRRSLEDYFQNHAIRMREEGRMKFGNQFTASRRILSNSVTVASPSL